MAEITVQAVPPGTSEIDGVVGVRREQRRRGPAGRPLADRLWEKVDKNGPTQPHMESPCWEFTGGRSYDGYGMISSGGHCGKMLAGSRAAWIVTHGPIPPGMDVCHRCDHPPCCRPDHLFLGTRSENMKDAFRKGRVALGPPPRNEGERNGRAKLTAAQVEEIRSMPGTAAAAAAAFGVSKATVYAIRQGRIWRSAA